MIHYPKTRLAYAAARDHLLSRLSGWLDSDPRFAAAWLAGSFGRGEQDEVSDIDLVLVVEDAHAGKLCRVTAMTGPCESRERMALFSSLGPVGIVHENHHNAPPGGTFSAVFYREPPVIVDWVLVPRALAYRPPQTRVLFDHIDEGLPQNPPPAQPAPSQVERVDLLEERQAFFWMMAAVLAKYIVRGDNQKTQPIFEIVRATANEIQTLRGETPLNVDMVAPTSREDYSALLRQMCDAVQAGAKGGRAPLPQIEAILSLD